MYRSQQDNSLVVTRFANPLPDQKRGDMRKLILTLTLTLTIFAGTCFSDDSLSTTITSGKDNVKVITQEPTNPDQAKIVIDGLTTAEVGDLVVISVEASNAKSFKWLVTPSTDNILVIDDGKRIVFSSGELGKYTFTVAGALGDTVDLASHTVEIVGPAVPLSELESKITSWCELVESPTKRDECLALAQSFSSIATMIEAGNLTTASDIVAATSLSNKAALGESLETWLPFRDGLVNHLTELAAKGELPNPSAHSEVWNNIASALRGVAKTL